VIDTRLTFLFLRCLRVLCRRTSFLVAHKLGSFLGTFTIERIVAKAQVEAANAGVETSRAQLRAANAQIGTAKAAIATAKGQVENAKAALAPAIPCAIKFRLFII